MGGILLRLVISLDNESMATGLFDLSHQATVESKGQCNKSRFQRCNDFPELGFCRFVAVYQSNDQTCTHPCSL